MANILVIGGGLAGMMAALNAREQIECQGAGVSVALISPTPFITMRPRLYEKQPERLREPLKPSLESVGIDPTVLVELDGRVRRQSEFDMLFKQAGLKLLRVIETESTFHLMELMVDRG